jgi:hypothetical protein
MSIRQYPAMINLFIIGALFLSLVPGAPLPQPQVTYAAGTTSYVDSTATGNDDCTSWADACTSLQDALGMAGPGDEIWVAAGTYKPTSDTQNRDASFSLPADVAIYGGFPPGGAATLNERDWGANPTILSGDIDNNDTTDTNGVVAIAANIQGSNSYHVVKSDSVTETTVLDGFIITAGQANGDGTDNRGGGMVNTDSRPTLRNLMLSGNAAQVNGGGIFNDTSAITLTNVVLSGNTAINGGAMVNNTSTITLTNVTISGNAATHGGGIYNDGTGSLAVQNSIVWANDANGIEDADGSTITLSVQNSIVQGGPGGAMDVMPRFVHPPLPGPDSAWGTGDDVPGNLHLLPSSPAIDAGDNAPLPQNGRDLDANPRIGDGDGDGTPTVDMGAYEFQCPTIGTAYVDTSATGQNNGTTWANGYTEVRDGFALAHACPSVKQIRVATGIYKPTPDTTDRDASFLLPAGVAVYGGFPRGGAIMDGRNWQINPTVLSGDIDNNDTTDARGIVARVTDIQGNNSYHVVRSNGVTETAVLDGFFITGGQANEADPHDDGAGMYAYNSTPMLGNLVFSGNSATDKGGGVYNNQSNPTMFNVTFSGNSANQGGGIYNYLSSPTIANAAMSLNTVLQDGGAMANDGSSPTLINVSIAGNSALQGAGVYNTAASTMTLQNSIVWGNDADGIVDDGGSTTTVQHSIVQGGTGGGLDVDPRFVSLPGPGPDGNWGTDDDVYGNLMLMAASPAIDTGDNALLPPDTHDLDNDKNTTEPLPVDLAGGARVVDGNNDNVATVDMGAFETQCPVTHTLYVDASATGGHTGLSWTDAYTDMQAALAVAQACPLVTEVRVAAGVYKPATPTNPISRTVSFVLPAGTAVYGGFPRGGSAWSGRDWQANPTILSGDIDNNDTDPDGDGVIAAAAQQGNNSYHVVVSAGVTETAVLDGFIITAGRADGPTEQGSGGGLANANSSPTLTNLRFIGNVAIYGAGMANATSNPTLVNVVFNGNVAGLVGGGMVNSVGSSPTLINTTFSNNVAMGGGGGGAMYDAESSTPQVHNSILWGNTPDAIAGDGTGTANVQYSIVQGGSAGTGNIDADPLFVDPVGSDLISGTLDDNLHLQPCSPALEMGNTTAVPSDTLDLDRDGDQREYLPYDLAGNMRFFDGDGNGSALVDIGAYERQEVVNYGTLSFTEGSYGSDEGNDGLSDHIVATVQRSGGNQCQVSAIISRTAGTATTPADFTNTFPISVTFADGETAQKPVNLPIVGDDVAEFDETIGMSLSTIPKGVQLGAHDTTTFTIRNDDGGLFVLLDISNDRLDEDGGTAVISATLSEATTEPVTVTLQFSGTVTDTDYVTSSNQIIIAAGILTGTTTIMAVDDALIEGDETIIIEIVSVENAQESGEQKVTAVIVDDDAAAVRVAPASLTVSEPDGSDTFTVTLSSRPTANVSLSLAASNSQCSVAPTTVELSDATWQDGVLVTVAAIDDTEIDGDQTCIIETSTTSSSDPDYNGIEVDDVTVTVQDDEVAPGEIEVNPTSLTVSEPDGSDTFTIMLSSEPTADVTISLATSNSQCSVAAESVVLNSSNWESGAEVTVTAIDDAEIDGDQTCVVETGTASSDDTAYDGDDVDDVTVTVQDDDTTPGKSYIFLPLVIR